MLRSHSLGMFISKNGGADDQLFGGASQTSEISSTIAIRTDRGRHEYKFTLECSDRYQLNFTEEAFRFIDKSRLTSPSWTWLGSGHRESRLVEIAQSIHDHTAAQHFPPDVINLTTARVIMHLLKGSAVYQFHNTSDMSNLKKSWDVSDNVLLRTDGGNLAAILYRLEHEDFARYKTICNYITEVLPIFDQFHIDESFDRVYLRWRAKGTDKTIGANLTSDGSLRFFALITLLNLPSEMLPTTILLDEPELGLHPSAINLVGSIIDSLSEKRQMIIATQSPLLVDCFRLEKLVILEMKKHQTEFRRLNSSDYRAWLKDGFSTGELWQKNLFGGNP